MRKMPTFMRDWALYSGNASFDTFQNRNSKIIKIELDQLFSKNRPQTPPASFSQNQLPSYNELLTSNHHTYRRAFTWVDRKINTIIDYYEREQIRVRTLNALTDPQYCRWGVKSRGIGSTYVQLNGYDSLDECRCVSTLKRLPQSDTRKFLSELIHISTKSLQSKKTSPVRISVIGSGQLLNEVFLLAMFVKNKLHNLQFDLVDIANRDDTRYEMMDAAAFQKSTVRQFLTILHYGLGLGIQDGKTPVYDSCKRMNGEVRSFAQELRETSYSLPSNNLTVSFFGSTQEYARYLTRYGKSEKPEIVYDIDLESRAENHSQIISPVKKVLPQSTIWFSAFKNPRLRGRYSDITVTAEVNDKGLWTERMRANFLG